MTTLMTILFSEPYITIILDMIRNCNTRHIRREYKICVVRNLVVFVTSKCAIIL